MGGFFESQVVLETLLKVQSELFNLFLIIIRGFLKNK